MRFFLLSTLALTLVSDLASGVDFTSLSRTEPVSTVYQAETKCYVDASLMINLNKVNSTSAYLRIRYIIGNDTLTDNMWVDGSYSGVVKELFLEAGERITAQVFLNNSDQEEFTGIEGSFTVMRNLNMNLASDQGKNSFIGDVWKSDQTPLFRVNTKDSTAKVFRLQFELNQNFEFDRLYFKVKVISPIDGILMLKNKLIINDDQHLTMSRKVFSIDLNEIDMSQPGSYYVQVMSDMDYMRINGVESVNYELVEQ